jgi:hypothetical protein
MHSPAEAARSVGSLAISMPESLDRESASRFPDVNVHNMLDNTLVELTLRCEELARPTTMDTPVTQG